METVQPIKDIAYIHEIKDYLKSKNERDHLLFSLGINTGLRISDMLKLRVIDVKNKDVLIIVEQKTKKTKKKNKKRIIAINDELKTDIRQFCSGKREYEYLFRSAKGNNEPIKRVQAWRILKEAGKYIGLNNLGCHSTRKTFGYFLYIGNGDNAEIVQEALNKSTTRDTLRYIGITQESVNTAIKNLSFDGK